MSRARRAGGVLLSAGILAAAPGAAAALLTGTVVPTIHDRMFPWLLGRALGLAAYATLAGVVALGLLVQHPGARTRALLHPELRLRLHASLAAATLVLLVAHLSVLALDRYAGVGWRGALLPGTSTYRPFAVALGVISFELLLVVTVSAALAGRRGTRAWLPIHRGASLVFIAAFAHGALAGSDTIRLRAFYVLSGGALLALALSRARARRRQRALALPAERGREPATLAARAER